MQFMIQVSRCAAALHNLLGS